jgi:Fic family protein
MTKLSERKTKLSFTTGAEIRYRGKLRAVVVEVENAFTANVRLAGTRQRYPFSWHGLHDWAAELYARSERDRKKKERLERRKAVGR